jgi:hypothetical protein
MRGCAEEFGSTPSSLVPHVIGDLSKVSAEEILHEINNGDKPTGV